MYTEQDLVAVARRENNNKRKYLVVNPLQAKHVPVHPGKTMQLFLKLADILKKDYEGERLLLIGFAETATAIGAALAVELQSLYIQTTRENLEGVEYLYFSEVHSHAAQQRLSGNDMDAAALQADKIIFVEDEVTTGNTILNIIDILEKRYPDKFSFAVASLLNGMDKEAQECYAKRNIKLHYLLKTSHETFTELAEQYAGDGKYMPADGTKPAVFLEHIIQGAVNPRRLVTGAAYERACAGLWRQLSPILSKEDKRMLVLGTEEFMYPAIYVGVQLEAWGKDVFCHATTRSPIVVSSEAQYPLHVRYALQSLYEKERNTFVYDLQKYDCVIVITDAGKERPEGTATLINALKLAGNDRIHLVRWENEKFL